ncbi:hypothetical protein HNQ56_004535 [Anaerotaenia torta]|uniref:hypothetical protein n=1 Tax=Anaerotaenia torta TaxID=433293 RepID=UPI003D1AADEC
MPKETRLADDAVIYQQRQELTEKQKLKDMSNQEKLAYLWEYYRIHALAAIAAIALIAYIIYEIVTPDIETLFQAAIIDSPVSDEVWEQYRAQFEEYLDLNPELQEIQLNSSFYLSSDGEYAMNMQQVFAARVAAREIDVIIAPESRFKSLTYSGYMDKLTDRIPTDLYASLAEYMFQSDTEAEPDRQSVYGIYLTSTKLFSENSVSPEPYLLGIVANAEHKDNAAEFLRMLFNE